MNLISVRIVKSAAFECDCAGVVEETSSPASAVGGSSWEPVLTLPRREQSGSRSSGRPLDCQSAFKYCMPNYTRSRPSVICGHSAVSGLWKDPVRCPPHQVRGATGDGTQGQRQVHRSD